MKPALNFSRLDFIIAAFALFACCTASAFADTPDLILHSGKIITVDKAFSIKEAIAVKDGSILAVGTSADILKLQGNTTKVIDLKGKTVLPGLMDSHTHPVGAAMHEYDHDIPDMQSIADVLAYVKARTKVLEKGEWVFISQVFITRLAERRYPTREELDSAAPENPVVFRTGPDASLNSLAMKLSGIDKDFKDPAGGEGKAERDEKGEPTGILRNLGGAIKYQSPKSGKTAGQQDRYRRVLDLFKDYNAVGLTSIADRDCGKGNIDLYQKMLDNGDLPLRVGSSRSLGTGGNPDAIRFHIKTIAEEPQAPGKPGRSDMLKIVGLKIYLDGGMLTGSARMRQPWGLSKIYSIDDPNYKGVFRTVPEKLAPIIAEAVEHKLQFTAHSVGDGAVHALIEAYEEVNKTKPVRETRPCITHCNFMSAEAIERMKKIGIVADIQPAWLYLDAATLNKQFGDERLRYFQPLKSLFESGVTVGGGSDHMQKIGSLRSVNPYNPWLGMWITIARKPRNYEGVFHAEESLSREQAIRFYTINNAYLLFNDDITGSLEKGKRADLIIIDRDILTCKVDDIKDTQVQATYLEGKVVYEKK
ncbi:MAG: amidohydrolase [Phycisphaeraceae bacterium]